MGRSGPCTEVDDPSFELGTAAETVGTDGPRPVLVDLGVTDGASIRQVAIWSPDRRGASGETGVSAFEALGLTQPNP